MNAIPMLAHQASPTKVVKIEPSENQSQNLLRNFELVNSIIAYDAQSRVFYLLATSGLGELEPLLLRREAGWACLQPLSRHHRRISKSCSWKFFTLKVQRTDSTRVPPKPTLILMATRRV